MNISLVRSSRTFIYRISLLFSPVLNRYVYPIGYCTLREHKSVIDGHDRLWYKCEILDKGRNYPVNFYIFLLLIIQVIVVQFVASFPQKAFVYLNDRQSAFGYQVDFKLGFNVVQERYVWSVCKSRILCNLL